MPLSRRECRRRRLAGMPRRSRHAPTPSAHSYNDAGIRLGVAVFGATDKPQTLGHDPIALANEIGAFVMKYGLQGVDVE